MNYFPYDPPFSTCYLNTTGGRNKEDLGRKSLQSPIDAQAIEATVKCEGRNH